GGRSEKSSRGGRQSRNNNERQHEEENETDWRSLIGGKPFKFKGEEPDFNEEGWARRRPKKK
ncbi:MAG: hypothetical protein HXN97_08295, partial [Prevotella salivae]|nr:hypothetical protein [Segatella salivae]